MASLLFRHVYLIIVNNNSLTLHRSTFMKMKLELINKKKKKKRNRKIFKINLFHVTINEFRFEEHPTNSNGVHAYARQ